MRVPITMTQRGFTLVEIMVVALIMTLIGGALLVVAIAGRRVSDLTNARLTAMTSAQQAMNRLTEDLRLAYRSSDKKLTYTTFPRDPAQLGFYLQMPDGSFKGVLYARYPFVPDYRDSENKLQRRIVGEGRRGVKVVATGITDFQVACGSNFDWTVCDDSESLLLRITARVKSWQGPTMTQTVESQVWLRNPKS